MIATAGHPDQDSTVRSLRNLFISLPAEADIANLGGRWQCQSYPSCGSEVADPSDQQKIWTVTNHAGKVVEFTHKDSPISTTIKYAFRKFSTDLIEDEIFHNYESNILRIFTRHARMDPQTGNLMIEHSYNLPRDPASCPASTTDSELKAIAYDHCMKVP
jgi:hypothetical protein